MHYQTKIKKYSHHRIRLYLGFLITGILSCILGNVILFVLMIPKLVGFEISMWAILGVILLGSGYIMQMAYEEIQRWCSKGPILDRFEYGVVGYDENAVKGKAIPVTDEWKDKRERQLSRAFWGKANGQAKVVGMDGGKGDGFMGGEYCWVRERQTEMEVNKKKITIWQPYQAWSVQRGVLDDSQIEGKTSEEILAILERDEPFIKTGEKSFLSTYLFMPKTIIRPNPDKGIMGRIEIPLQVAEQMWNDPDWRDFSPVLWAYDVKTMFGGAGSKISSSDQFRLNSLEDETIDKTGAINRAQAAVSTVSNIAASSIKRDMPGMNR